MIGRSNRVCFLLTVFYSLVFTLTACNSVAFAQSAESANDLPSDLTEIGIKNLLDFDLVVTSPGKKEQPVSEVASAVYVLTGDDIRRMGVTHVAEALRAVPGVTVTRVSSNQWAISVRGFTQVFADKLLVLVDGVSIYSPTINGVYWETNELPIEDIERIEVIRGPGASLWGANAVNGVINIITKHSKDTVGNLVSAGGGSNERAFGALRHGGTIGDSTNYRVYTRYNDRDSNEFTDGSSALDNWHDITEGIRIDSKIDEKNSLLFNARGHSHEAKKQTVSSVSLGPPFIDNESVSGDDHWTGATVSTGWNHQFAQDSYTSSELSYRYLNEESKLISFRYDILDFEQTYRFTPIERHDFISGINYRFFNFDSDGSLAQSFDPDTRKTDLYTTFIQDDITIVPDKLFFIVGTRLEKNASTDLEFMPNGRLLWTPNKSQSVWFAVSRAVTSPPLVLEDIVLPVAAFPADDMGNVGVATIFGSRQVESQNLLAYETGYRQEISKQLSLDLALFYNIYDDIFSIEAGGAPRPGRLPNSDEDVLLFPLAVKNDLTATSIGGELTVAWTPLDFWRISTSYSYINLNVDLDNSTDTSNKELIEDGTPSHQINLRSFVSLPWNLEFDSVLRNISKIGRGDIDAYTELDSRIGWRPRKDFDLSVVGNNLLQDEHQEFLGNLFGPPPTKIERGVYVKATLQF